MRRVKKFFILGCNGMAGHMISRYFQENGHEVTGFARRSSDYIKIVIGDIHDKDLLHEIILNSTFDVIINCIGLLNQDAEKNKSEAVYINSYIPHFLAELRENPIRKYFR